MATARRKSARTTKAKVSKYRSVLPGLTVAMPGRPEMIQFVDHKYQTADPDEIAALDDVASRDPGSVSKER